MVSVSRRQNYILSFDNMLTRYLFSTNSTLQIFYSDVQGVPLKAVLPAPVPNDNSGFGQFQIGILKKPTGDTSDVVNKGFQPAGINEGQIYGGLFVEDSANGCVSL